MYGSSLSILVLFPIFSVCDNVAEAPGYVEMFQIEGKVYPPTAEIINKGKGEGLLPFSMESVKILVDGGDYLAFPREDGSFVLNGIPTGSYLIEISTPNYNYEVVRVDISQRGKVRARKVNFVQTSQVVQLPYPLKMKPKGVARYFQMREQWRITDFLFSPMVLMMVLPLVLLIILPKMITDPETRKEMEQINIPKYDMPELSEVMTNLFGAGTDRNKKTAIAKSKKRQ